MKLTFKTMILATLVAGSTACTSDWLDLQPSDSINSATAVKNYKDAYAAMIGIYDAIQEDEKYYGAGMFYYGDVRGEDMQSSSESARSSSVYQMLYTRDNAPAIWGTPYKVIRLSNNLLSAINGGKVSDAAIYESKLNVLKAEALTARALAHFDLVRVYGLPYTVDNGKSYGVPVVLESLAGNALRGRNTVAEVYEQVIADLTSAIELYDGESYTALTSEYFNQWATKALLSRVYLYKGDNAASLELAKDVIANSSAKLWANDEYVGAWSKGGNSELLFEIVNKNTSDWVDRESLGYLMSEDGYGDILITEKFLDLLLEDPNDVRINLTARASKDNDETSKKRMYLKKYPGRSDNSPIDPRVNNIPVLRLSEVYLNAAEAAFKSGNTAEASELLNAIVLRANPEAASVSDITLERILEERRKELVGEGHRFFDAMRNNQTVVRYNSVDDKGWQLSLITESQSFDNTYFRAILPIPKEECDANPVIRVQQNPGY